MRVAGFESGRPLEAKLQVRASFHLAIVSTNALGKQPSATFWPHRYVEVRHLLSHSGSCVRLCDPAPALGRHWLRYLCPTNSMSLSRVCVITCAHSSRGGRRAIGGLSMVEQRYYGPGPKTHRSWPHHWSYPAAPDLIRRPATTTWFRIPSAARSKVRSGLMLTPEAFPTPLERALDGPVTSAFLGGIVATCSKEVRGWKAQPQGSGFSSLPTLMMMAQGSGCRHRPRWRELLDPTPRLSTYCASHL